MFEYLGITPGVQCSVVAVKDFTDEDKMKFVARAIRRNCGESFVSRLYIYNSFY